MGRCPFVESLINNIKVEPLNLQIEKKKEIPQKIEEKEKILQTGVKVGEHWQGIYDYFSRCLVKSTAESRASGAGAGIVDTD